MILLNPMEMSEVMPPCQENLDKTAKVLFLKNVMDYDKKHLNKCQIMKPPHRMHKNGCNKHDDEKDQ